MRVNCLVGLLFVATQIASGESLSELEARSNAAAADGLKSISFASQFAMLYPQAKHYISYYTSEKTAPVWNSKIGIHGRYVLSMQIPLRIDRATNKVSADGEPQFYLREVTSITWLPDGRVIIHYEGEHVGFGEDQWR